VSDKTILVVGLVARAWAYGRRARRNRRSDAEGACGLFDDFGEAVCAGAAALGEVWATAAAAFERAAGFAQERVHVAVRVGGAREDQARGRLVARAEQRHRASVRRNRRGETAKVFRLAPLEDARHQPHDAAPFHV
jgi:hypothetical protein